MTRPPLPAGPYLVVGLARSGSAAARALLARGESVIGTDRDGLPAPEGAETAQDGLEALDRAGCVVKSPGVASSEPLIAAARERGVPVIGELELAWRLLENDFIAVTGTNGKTTTVELLGAIHEACGVPAVVAGNVGRAASLLAIPPIVAPDATIVCEASSFQLEDTLAFAPRAAVLLNIAPDHLDRHADMAAYTAAKLRAFVNQTSGDLAVLPLGSSAGGDAARVTFGTAERADMRLAGERLWWRGEAFVDRSQIRLRGPHNAENAMAAAAVALSRGLDAGGVRRALGEFAGVEHRLEEVASIDGVLFVNDSKATNVASALVALRSFEPGTIHLILGGRGKGEDFGGLRADVAARARAVYLVGEAAEEIGEALHGLATRRSGTLEQAVADARAGARAGEVVLLSPACTSFDQFRDYEERGEAFRALARG
ncbi:MAG TPA: UDP-N-acetylmuramoyl-L-alanine--D-glutamate ligase [Solirubrobacteraceae bacterium]|jgi:UDP-N-acetylmuramoylalanine--D-glutamate ligase